MHKAQGYHHLGTQIFLFLNNINLSKLKLTLDERSNFTRIIGIYNAYSGYYLIVMLLSPHVCVCVLLGANYM